MDDVARAGADAIMALTGRHYQVGSPANTMYAASGNSLDYAYAVMQIPITLTMELTGGRNEDFDIPPSQILDAVQETWAGVRAMVMKVGEMY